MLTVDDIAKGVLISSSEEWANQLKVLGYMAAININSYRKVLSMIDDARKLLPDVEWVQARLAAARDAAVNSWVSTH